MARINGTGGEASAASRMKKVGENLISEHNTVLQAKAGVNNMIGLENYTETGAYDAREQVQGNLERDMLRALEQSGIATEHLTGAQKAAGTAILMASGDPVAYANKAMETEFPALESGQTDAPMSVGTYDNKAETIGLEYFNDNVTLDTHMAASFTFNVQAARQGELAEAFFPTIVADPTECGLLIEIKKTMIHRAVRHSLREKDSARWNRRNILDAATDPEVLVDQSIIFVPHALVDGSNSQYFVPSTQFTPFAYKVGDYSVETAPLAFTGEEKHLMELSAHPGLTSSGVLDESDEFDGRFALKNLYIEFRKPSQKPGEGQLVKLKTRQLARASFNAAQEGDGRELHLNFRDAKFSVNRTTRDVAGKPVKALEELGDNNYQLVFTVNVNSTVNVQTGYEEANASRVRPLSVTDEDKNVIAIEGPMKTLVDAVVMEAAGYDYDATRSNTNRRTKGLLVDHVSERERYKITLGSPITSRKPTNHGDDSNRLNDLITTARLRNDNLAITKLLEYSEQLKEVVHARTDEYEIASIEGTGRHYIAPWFDEFNFNAPEQVASLENVNVAENLADSILGVLREQVVRAYQESRFQPAMEMMSAYTQSKPKVIIGTDVKTANWLYTKGDVRTLGDQFEFRIVTTNDKRFRGRIQWAFTVETTENGFSPLNFGNHLWVPELITNTNLTRNEATANELTVQPRNYHIVNCPITGIIHVKGIAEVVTTKPAIDVVTRKSLGETIGDEGGSVLPPIAPEA